MSILAGIGDFGLEALRNETKGYRDEAKIFSEMSQAIYEDKGLYDPVLNLPPLTANSSIGAGAKPQEYTISKDGNLQFAIEGFAAGYAVKVDDKLRQLSNNKWYVFRDQNAQLIAQLEKLVDIIIPLTADTQGLSADSGIAIAASSKIQIPPNTKGEGTVIWKPFTLSTYPDIKPGDTLRFTTYITESIAGISDSGKLKNEVYASRNGAIVTGTTTNKTQTRVASNKMVFSMDYVVQAGDTLLSDMIIKFNHFNGSASTWEWQVTRMELSRINIKYGSNNLSDTFFDQNKRLGEIESDVAQVETKVSVIDGKIITPNLANPANFEHGKVMGSDGVKLSSATLCLSGNIKVTPGIPYSGQTTTNGMRYVVYFNASNTPIGGINAVWTFTFTPPPNTDYVRVTFLEAESSTFMLTQSPAPQSFVAFGMAITQNLKISAADVVTSQDNQMVSEEQIDSWNNLLPIAERIVKENLADPSLFTAGKLMQSNGVPITAAPWTYCRVPVVAGTQYYCNTDANTGCRYACFLQADGTSVVASSGWNGPENKTFTAPVGAAFFLGTFPTANAGTFRCGLGATDPGYVPFTSYITKDIIVQSSDVNTNQTKQFVSQTEKDSWNYAKLVADKFKKINLADPSLFTTGKVLQSNGAAVTAPTFSYTGKIPVAPGQVISANTAADTGFRYCCFFAANGTTVVSGGWDGVNTKTFTVPANAYFVQGTFPTPNIDTVMVQVAPAPTSFVPYSNSLYANEIYISADSVVTGSDKTFISTTEKARLATLSYLDDKFNAFEAKGILQKKIVAPSPIANDISEWVKLLLQGEKDIITDCENGSKSTGVAGYCSPTPNSNTWPEFCREQNLYTKWVGYMWRTYFHSQKHERFDTTGKFAITGDVTVTATNNAPHWGHQWPNSATGEDFGGPQPIGQVYFDRYYQIIKPNTSGAVAAVSFSLPNSFYKLAWITSHSHLTGTITFTVSGGANRLERLMDPDTDTWGELHNSTWNTATPDEFKAVAYNTSNGNSTKIRKDQHSMPLIIRRKAGFTLSDSTVITATMEAGKQIEHWGIYYTRSKRLFIPVCSAKGSHGSIDLAPFHEFGIDKRKPSLFLYDVPIVNEWRVASVTPTDTPTQYATRIKDFAAEILGKPYIKGLLCRYGMWHRNMFVFEAAADQPTQYLTAEGYNNGFDYMRRSINELKALQALGPNAGRMAISDAQPAFLEYMRNYSADKGISMYAATWSGAYDVNADTPTMDGTHDGNMGAEIQWRFDMNNWNF